MDKVVKKKLVWSLVIIVVCVIVDQWTKILAVEHLKGYIGPNNERSIKVLGDFFVLTFAYNTGAFLGMGNQLTGIARLVVLNLIPIAAVLGAFVFVLRKTIISKIEFVSINLLIAGGIGNIIDRVFNDGRVVDFMVFDTGIGILHTGVVNVADIVITAGVIILLFDSFFMKKKKDGAQEEQVA